MGPALAQVSREAGPLTLAVGRVEVEYKALTSS